jgi:hypothetical protein
MPQLRVLELDPAWSVTGIQRWPGLANLVLGGNVRDLTPLRALAGLTHLTLKTDRLRNVAQLIDIPQLRYLLVDSEHPVDFSPLIDAPQLREIEMKRCEANKMELATLNSILPPWDDVFGIKEPRKLGPLARRIVANQQVFQTPNPGASLRDEVDKDPGMFESEARWFRRKLQRKLDRFLDSTKWGEVEANGNGFRVATVSIYSLEAAESLRDIIQIAREVLAQMRYGWQVLLRVSLQTEWQVTHPELEKEIRRRQLIEEELDFEARQKQRRDFLERKHRAELLEQEGMKVNPADFAASEEEITEDDLVADVEDAGEPEDHPMADRLNCMAILTESELIAGESAKGALFELLG